eukprot:TRINITY_DN2240_c0_g1_i11.p3 TRINITY_DN2240_c0_g1~~TRINITY_DN2240_c0_g1_i11.p3  ORF type:complete len:137 (-),score=15.99 TRINITY_DN2240_c0_g1_i11:440-850(-)
MSLITRAAILSSIIALTLQLTGIEFEGNDTYDPSLVNDVSNDLVDMTSQDMQIFLSNPTNETLMQVLETLALPLGHILQLVLESGMNVTQSANLVGLIVGEWLNLTVAGNVSALDVGQVELDVVESVENGIQQNSG